MFKIKGKDKNQMFKRKRDNYKRKLKVKRFADCFQRELQDSTIHGLTYIVETDIYWPERLFWTVTFILASGLIYVLLSSQYARFMEAPVITSVEKDYFNWNVSYPAIILCPMNKVDEESLKTLVDEYKAKTGQDIGQYFKAISSVSLDTLYEMHVPSEAMIPLLNPQEYAKICSKLLKKFDETSLTTKTKWPLTVQEVMTEMGMCHIINSNVAIYDNPSRWSDTTIVYDKTNIQISYHDRDFYVQILNYSNEYQIYTSSPDDVIPSGTPSLSVNSEGYLSFGVHISITRALPELRSMPLSLRKCRFIDEPDSIRFPVYSYNRCLIECRIKMMLKLCGCIPHLYKPIGAMQKGNLPIPRVERLNMNAACACAKCRLTCTAEKIGREDPLTGLSGAYQESLMFSSELVWADDILSKGNEKICSLTQLKCILIYNREIITLSASNDTLELFEDTKNIPRSSRACGCLADCEADVYHKDSEVFLPQESLNMLRIRVATFPKVKFVRQIMFSFYDLFLKGGGVINLCIGTSVISFMELLLIILRVSIQQIVIIIQKFQKFEQK